MDSDSPPGPGVEETGSDDGSTSATNGVRLAVAVVLSAILGFVGNVADVSALIDKVSDDGPSSLVPIAAVLFAVAVIAVVVGVVRHHKLLTAARLRLAAAVVASLGAGFLIANFPDGTDSPPPTAEATSKPPTSTSAPTTAPPPPPTTKGRTVTSTGAITAPAADSGVQRCAFVTGTSRLAPGQTLILAVRNLDNDESTQWYVQYPRGWNTPSTLSTWTGVEYFPGDINQHYEIGLFAVDLRAAVSAHAAGERASNNLAQGATPLDTRKVVQREGGTGSDCD